MNKSKLLVAVLVAFNLCTPAALAAGDWTWPVRGDVLTRYRNGDDAYAAGQHRGIDIAARTGEPVVAAASGTVTFAGVAGSSGLTVALRTSDGRFDTSYLHLSSTAVRKGDAVASGERLGAVGTSGQRSAEPPHLHFGVREAGSRHAYRDPLTLLPPPPRERPAPGPRPAPVPVVAPQPVAPAPAPVPGVAALPVLGLGPASAPRVHPAPRRVRVPAAGRRHGAPSRPPAPVLVARSAVAPSHHAPQGVRSLSAKPAVQPFPHLGAQGAGPRSAAGAQSHARPRSAPAHAHRRHGIDVGWLLACVGLVGAAAALGRSGKRPERASSLAARCLTTSPRRSIT